MLRTMGLIYGLGTARRPRARKFDDPSRIFMERPMRRLFLVLTAALTLLGCRTRAKLDKSSATSKVQSRDRAVQRATAALVRALGDRQLVIAGEIELRGGVRVARLKGKHKGEHVVGSIPAAGACGCPKAGGLWLVFRGDPPAVLHLCGGSHDGRENSLWWRYHAATWWGYDADKGCLAPASQPHYSPVTSLTPGMKGVQKKTITVGKHTLELTLTTKGFTLTGPKTPTLRYLHRTAPVRFKRGDPTLRAASDPDFKRRFTKKPASPKDYLRNCNSASRLAVWRAGDKLLLRFYCSAVRLYDDVWFSWSAKQPRLKQIKSRSEIFDELSTGCDKATIDGQLRHEEHLLQGGAFVVHRERVIRCIKKCNIQYEDGGDSAEESGEQDGELSDKEGDPAPGAGKADAALPDAALPDALPAPAPDRFCGWKPANRPNCKALLDLASLSWRSSGGAEANLELPGRTTAAARAPSCPAGGERPASRAHHFLDKCNHALSDLWFDAAKRRVFYCLAACSDDAVDLHQARQACFSYNPVSGAVVKIASLTRRPGPGLPSVSVKGRRVKVCKGAQRCRTVVLRKEPDSAAVSASGKLLAALHEEDFKDAEGELSNRTMAEIYRVKSGRRVSRFVAFDQGTGSVELQWLGEILCSHQQPGTMGEALILDWRTGKTRFVVGHNAKEEGLLRFSEQRASHVAANRWAFFHLSGESLVIQDVVRGAFQRIPLGDRIKMTGTTCAGQGDMSRAVGVGASRVVLMGDRAPFPITLIDLKTGKIVRQTETGCPGV